MQLGGKAMPSSSLLAALCQGFSVPLCALLAAPTGAPCAAFSARAEVQQAAAGLQQLLCCTAFNHPAWAYGWHAAD